MLNIQQTFHTAELKCIFLVFLGFCTAWQTLHWMVCLVCFLLGHCCFFACLVAHSSCWSGVDIRHLAMQYFSTKKTNFSPIPLYSTWNTKEMGGTARSTRGQPHLSSVQFSLPGLTWCWVQALQDHATVDAVFAGTENRLRPTEWWGTQPNYTM